MLLKTGLFFMTLLFGINALPDEDNDMSIYFDHTDSLARMFGGTTAGRVPYMVAISSGDKLRNLMCGGSLVSKTHVLTAAHCIDATFIGGHLRDSLRVIVGTNYWNTSGTVYSLTGNVTHPDYDRRIIKNDIGFLITATEVELTKKVSLISLNFDFINAGVRTSVTGWGVTRFGGTVSQELLQLSAIVVDGDQCVIEVAQRALEYNMLGVPPVDPDLEICNYKCEGYGVCSGDSGGPLMRSDTNQQIGVVSWGLPCARGAPDMFARLSAYESWILQIIR